MSCPTLKMKIVEDEELKLALEDEKSPELHFSDVVEVTTSDYQKLINKPKINGEELLENYNEIDPTVPKWAKEPKKPEYTAEELNAVPADNEMSFTEIKDLWDSVFK